MKKLLIIMSVIILGGCARVIASNEKQISIKAPPSAAVESFRMAEEHCNTFGKQAVPSGTIYMNTTVFECR